MVSWRFPCLCCRGLLLAAVVLAGCLDSVDEDLWKNRDGSIALDAGDLGKDLGAVDSTGDHTAPDTKGPDLPSVACTAWSNWTCSEKVMNSISRCPQTGVQVYSLGCNVGGCSCTNKITLVGQPCSVSLGITCADAQAAFASGCCSGI